MDICTFYVIYIPIKTYLNIYVNSFILISFLFFINPNPTRIFLFGLLIHRSYCMSKKFCPFLYSDLLYKKIKINQIIYFFYFTRILLFGLLIHRSYCISRKSCSFLYSGLLYKIFKIYQIIFL